MYLYQILQSTKTCFALSSGRLLLSHLSYTSMAFKERSDIISHTAFVHTKGLCYNRFVSDINEHKEQRRIQYRKERIWTRVLQLKYNFPILLGTEETARDPRFGFWYCAAVNVWASLLIGAGPRSKSGLRVAVQPRYYWPQRGLCHIFILLLLVLSGGMGEELVFVLIMGRQQCYAVPLFCFSMIPYILTFTRTKGWGQTAMFLRKSCTHLLHCRGLSWFYNLKSR